MWGSLWDSVREGELDSKEYVELVVRNIKLETDESTVQTLLRRVSTAMRYYLSEPSALAGGTNAATKQAKVKPRSNSPRALVPPAYAGGSDLQARVEALLIDRYAKRLDAGAEDHLLSGVPEYRFKRECPADNEGDLKRRKPER